jgi:predicted phosphodiesterase
MVLKIQIVSDTHVEFWSRKKTFNFIKPSAPIIALLGDVGCVGSDDDFEIYKRFVSELIPQFEHIIIVPGNHEYYYNPPGNKKKATKDNTYNACNKKLKEYAKTSPKLHFLNNSTMKITVKNQKYSIIGSALWTWIPSEYRNDIQSHMNDYKYIYVKDPKTRSIRNITSTEVALMHLKNVRYIKSQITNAKKTGSKAIVLTHHKPYSSKKPDDKYTHAYETDLSYIFNKPMIIWCYGHTHIKDNTTIKGIKFVSNPKGYPYQQTLFDNSFTISI